EVEAGDQDRGDGRDEQRLQVRAALDVAGGGAGLLHQGGADTRASASFDRTPRSTALAPRGGADPGGRRELTTRGRLRLIVPNPHRGEIDRGLLGRVPRE